jgi:hypothetical protein
VRDLPRGRGEVERGVRAYNEARAFVAQDGTRPVPLHIRNAPTKLMKDLGYGKDYRYAHDEEDAYAAGESYLPDGMERPSGTADRSRARGEDPREARVPALARCAGARRKIETRRTREHEKEKRMSDDRQDATVFDQRIPLFFVSSWSSCFIL